MTVRGLGIVVIAGGLVAAAAGAQAEPKKLGCQHIQAVSQLSGGRMSADEMAAKLNTDVETVRDCLDNKKAKPSGGSLLGGGSQKPAPTPAPAAPAPQ